MKTGDKITIGLTALGIVGIFLVWRKAKNLNVASAAGGLVTGAAHVASEIVGGVVQGTASLFGVPTTNKFKCEAALTANKGFDASLYCPLPIYADYVVNGEVSAIKKLGVASIVPLEETVGASMDNGRTINDNNRFMLNYESSGGGIA